MSYADIEHTAVGTFHYNALGDWYDCDTTFREQPLRIRIVPDEEGHLRNVLERISSVLSELERLSVLAAEFAAERLLKTKNSLWLEANEAPFTEADFRAKLRLLVLVFYADGGVDFIHLDGGMFKEHRVRVSMDSTDHFSDAEIPF